MNILKEQKNELRAKYKALRRALPPEIKSNYDSMICKKFLELASYRYSETILVYAHLKDEIDITEIVTDALNKGKKVAFPRCGYNNTMTFHFVEDLYELKPGKMNILEPDENAPIYEAKNSASEPAVCFVPALVYDKEGFRLGYGGGYYDRYLNSFKGSKIGLIYSDFIVDNVPRGKYDLAVDVLITEKGVRIPHAI